MDKRTSSTRQAPNPFSSNIVDSAEQEGKGADITVEIVADWTLKAVGAVAAGIVIYNAVKSKDTASS